MNAVLAQLRALGTVRLAALGGAAIAVLGLLGWFVLRAGQPPMALLYADLDPRDAGQVVAALERARVPHRIEAGGTRILAPESDVPRLRLTLAREGLPRGGSVGYEIFVRSFADSNGDGQGDLPGITARLPYLAELGVNLIWLTPIHPSPSYHGYDVSDYEQVHRDLGTLDDFDKLVRTAHQLQLRVVLDLVVNHTSQQHPWFMQALSAPAGSEAAARYVIEVWEARS